MIHLTRSALISSPIAAALTLVLTFGASAQVATLSSPDETPTPPPDGLVDAEFEFADREEALLVFAQCMRDNGIDMDDPVAGERGRFFGGGPGSDDALDRGSDDYQLALQACADIMEAARPDLDPAAEQERLEEQLLIAQCFRDNGYPEYPDPVIGSDGGLQRGGQRLDELGLDPRSEEFQNTRLLCSEQLGLEDTGRGPGGFGPGPGSE